MKLTLSTSTLRPTTMAAIIADLLDMPVVDGNTIANLVAAIEASVGEEMAIEFLADAGISPEQLEWHVAL